MAGLQLERTLMEVDAAMFNLRVAMKDIPIHRDGFFSDFRQLTLKTALLCVEMADSGAAFRLDH